MVWMLGWILGSILGSIPDFFGWARLLASLNGLDARLMAGLDAALIARIYILDIYL